MRLSRVAYSTHSGKCAYRKTYPLCFVTLVPPPANMSFLLFHILPQTYTDTHTLMKQAHPQWHAGTHRRTHTHTSRCLMSDRSGWRGIKVIKVIKYVIVTSLRQPIRLNKSQETEHKKERVMLLVEMRCSWTGLPSPVGVVSHHGRLLDSS